MYLEIDREFLEKNYPRFRQRGEEIMPDENRLIIEIDDRHIQDSNIVLNEDESLYFNLSTENLFIGAHVPLRDDVAKQIARYIKEKIEAFLDSLR